MNRFGVVMLIAPCLLAGCGSSSPPETDSVQVETEKAHPAKVGSAKAAPTFDVPSLVSKNIDGIKAVLGKPEDDTERVWPGGDDENSKEWNKNGKMLLVTFRKKTRKVVDFFIGCDSSSGACSDKQHLLQIGKLKEGDARYRIEFVPASGRPDEYTGVKAIPN